MAKTISELPKLSPPENLTTEEKDALGYLYNMALDGLDIRALSLLAIDTICKDDTLFDREDAFLTSVLDEKNEIQGELAAQVSSILESNGFTPPEQIVIQVFNRKGGYSTKNEKTQWNYGVVIGINDFQVYNYDGKEYLIDTCKVGSTFDLSKQLPYVIRNRIKCVFKDKRAKLKSKQYLAIMCWGYWKDYPKKPKEKIVKKSKDLSNEILEDKTTTTNVK